MAQPLESKKASESAWRVGCVVGFIATALLYAHLDDVESWKWWVPAVGVGVGRSSIDSWDTSNGPAWVLVASALALIASAFLLSVYFVALAVVAVLLIAVVHRSLRTFRRARTGTHDGKGSVSFADGEIGRTANMVDAGVVSAWPEDSTSAVGYRDDAGGTRYRVLAGTPRALLERRLRSLARGALVLAVVVTASSIFLSEASQGESDVTTSSAASP